MAKSKVVDPMTVNGFAPVTEGEDEIITRERARHTNKVMLYRGVAEYLAGWSASVELDENNSSWWGPHYRYKLVDGQGHGIDLDFGSYSIPKGKVQVTGYWPQKGPNNGGWNSPHDVGETSPTINVGLDRGYEAIAKEITRRFLPEYLRIFAEIQEKIKADNDYAGQKAAAWERLVKTGFVLNPRQNSGGDPTGDVRVETALGGGKYNYDKGYGDVRLTGPDSVQIELRSLPVETAIRVLRAIIGERVEEQ